MFARRYLGRERQIEALFQTFQEAEGQALHPIQICRETGLDMHQVQQRLDHCPELFVRLPRNPEGLVRYRITSSAAVLDASQVKQLIRRRARSEQLQVTAAIAIVASAGLIILLTVIPSTSLFF
ncbi:MAG: hypothetical protein JJU22_12625 [Gammaproteobacteria bacterium]|nr:hypothetical protein [Gammaproteobacteria bacterium]